jgi:hypothetical protein
MDIKSKEIILRHLKGIVNELERDLQRQKEFEQLKIYKEKINRNDVKKNNAKSTLNLV